MEKNIVTEQQMELLKDAWESTRGTINYWKYDCEWSIKKKSGNWKFIGFISPHSFDKGYFKKIRGETYIYSMDGEERLRLDNYCKELLDIA